MRKSAELNKDFILSHVLINEQGCWEWQGRTDRLGYGRYGERLIHRLAYELFVGPVSMLRLVLHKCDNRCCCNPDHLFVGTQGDNMKDAYDKGRIVVPVPPQVKLTLEIAEEIRSKLKGGASPKQIEQEFGISKSVVSSVKHHRTWR